MRDFGSTTVTPCGSSTSDYSLHRRPFLPISFRTLVQWRALDPGPPARAGQPLTIKQLEIYSDYESAFSIEIVQGCMRKGLHSYALIMSSLATPTALSRLHQYLDRAAVKFLRARRRRYFAAKNLSRRNRLTVIRRVGFISRTDAGALEGNAGK